jgi:hypothetical protein
MLPALGAWCPDRIHDRAVVRDDALFADGRIRSRE